MPAEIITLDKNWQFALFPKKARKQQDLQDIKWQPAEIPNSIFYNLIDSGRIEKNDLYANPEKYQWVSEKTWIYKTDFNIPKNKLNADKINLIFEGLDTVTIIWLNGKLIKKTDNMFIHHSIDVTSHLRPGQNQLMIKFESPVQYSKNLMDKYSTFSESDYQFPHRFFIRKAQYQFGADFCPALPGCGIYRPVKLEFIKKAQISDIYIETIEANRKYADLKINVTLGKNINQYYKCILTLNCNEQILNHSLEFKKNYTTLSTIIRIKSPYLWNPRQLGHPNLYNLTAELFNENEILDSVTKKIGIRTVKLITEDKNRQTTFKFLLNNKPIYVKGANFLPLSLFPGSENKNTVKKNLKIASKANINVLRVCGNGMYGSEEFYSKCDELGILIWQDFMFDSVYYSDFPGFHANVTHEAKTIIKKLRNHPSLCLWCGHTSFLTKNTDSKLKNQKGFINKLFNKTLSGKVKEFSPSIPYIPSIFMPDRKEHDQKNTITLNDMNLLSSQPFESYLSPKKQIPKFTVQSGLQSMPHEKTLKKIIKNKPCRKDSLEIEKHNYQHQGISRLNRYAADIFGSPKNLKERIYFSQLTQARTLQINIDYLLINRQKNNGCIYRQLNDTFPAFNSSIIDSSLLPKAAFYYLKRTLDRFRLTLLIEPAYIYKTVPIFKPRKAVLINSTENPISANLTCSLYHMDGTLVDTLQSAISAGPDLNSNPVKLPAKFTLPDNPQETFLHLKAENHSMEISENTFIYLPDKYIQWKKPTIKKDLAKLNENNYLLNLTSDCFTKDLMIHPESDIMLENNYFDMLPHKSYEVKITAQKDLKKEDIRFTSVNNALFD